MGLPSTGLSGNLLMAGRLFRQSPGFAAATVITLAVGIGANTAIFTVANALLLRPLPYRQPERLVLIGAQAGEVNFTEGTLSWLRFQQVDREQRSFAAFAAFTPETFNATGRGDPEELAAARVSWNFFQILGVPLQGRGFRPPEDQPGGDNVAVISNSLWERRFGADAHAAGQQITLDGKDYAVVGVLPRGFQFAAIGPNVDVYVPRVFELNLATPAQVQAGAGFLNYLGRLRDRVSLARAQAELDTLAANYGRQNPKAPDSRVRLRAGVLQEQMVAGMRPAVLILSGAVGLVLLIACANVSNLWLSRALGRQREMAVRTALGATRGTLVGQLLAESLLLALVGGVAGVALSAWGTRVLGEMARGTVPLASEIRTDGTVLAFTAAISILAGALFGLAPALQVSRPNLNSVLREEGRSVTAGRRRTLFGNLLVISQVALSMILLIGAGLLLRNFIQLRDTAAGFDAHNLLTMKITLPAARYPSGSQKIDYYREVVRQVSAVPGVRQAAISSALPLNAVRFSPALPEGQPPVPLAERPLFNIQTLSPGYLEALRLPLLAGREFSEHDQGAVQSIAVNQAAVRRFWPNENPLGKHVLIGRLAAPAEVVGVIGDVHNTELAGEAHPEIYIPFAQLPWASMNLLVRTDGDPRAFREAVRRRVLSVDPDQPVTHVRSMEEVLAEGASQPRFVSSLFATLAGIALLLAIVGIYGSMAYSVSERTQEMGIRAALGAERSAILGLVLRQGLTQAGAGIAIGAAISLALSHLLTTLLYRVSPTDPAIFAGSAAVFAAVAALASYLPARRATRVDPLVALRRQ